MKYVGCRFFVFLVCCYCVLYMYGMFQVLPDFDHFVPYTPPKHSSVYVISLESPAKLLGDIKTFLKMDAMHVKAVNKTDTFRYNVPLYTLHTMENGRHDHMQIGNREMLGCLLSHISVWRQFLNSSADTVLVFEEDAIINERSASVFGSILYELKRYPLWSVVMLERGHTSSGVGWKALNESKFLLGCDGVCSWFGTRGYFLNREGARILLEYVDPYVVQVDALISLVSIWDPRFTMFATNTDVAHATRNIRSTVYDGCLKCWVPVLYIKDFYVVLYFVILILCICVISLFCVWYFKNFSERKCML